MLSIVYQFTMVEHSQSSPLSHLGVLNPSVQLTIECVPSTLRLFSASFSFGLGVGSHRLHELVHQGCRNSVGNFPGASARGGAGGAALRGVCVMAEALKLGTRL